MQIAFVWQGCSDAEVFEHWNDGLRAAMRILETTHNVAYYEPWEDIVDVDLILYWEAPVTYVGKNSEFYKKVQSNPIKKALLFAGGKIETDWVRGFDLLFVESKINEDECAALGIPYKRAFGINTNIFKPKNVPKTWDGIHQGTSASWKRQWLMAEALGEKALVVGRFQETDSEPFLRSQKAGAYVLAENMPYSILPYLICASNTMIQTSDYWGGGQRATLEAMACGVPVVCMTDSPKNREFVEESGFGEVVEPQKEQIKLAVERLKKMNLNSQIGVNYVNSKWTHEIYARNLEDGIQSICNHPNLGQTSRDVERSD